MDPSWEFEDLAVRAWIGSENSHDGSMFSLPELRILTIKSSNSHYRFMFSLPDLRILTTDPCSHYQIFEFSLPGLRILTADRCSHYRSSNSHYGSMFSLADLRILATVCFHYRSMFSLPDLRLSAWSSILRCIVLCCGLPCDSVTTPPLLPFCKSPRSHSPVEGLAPRDRWVHQSGIFVNKKYDFVFDQFRCSKTISV
jgi:hypothetical protein